MPLIEFAQKTNSKNSLFIFLLLECLALTSFALGGNNVLFYIVGILLCIVSFVFVYNRFSKNEIPSLSIYVVSTLVITLFASFGTLYSSTFGFQNILPFLGLNAFFLLGILIRRFNRVNAEHIILTIGISFALLLLISFIYSLSQYGFFYALIYKDTPIYYYNAELFDVTKETYFLSGFAFKEFSLSYVATFSLIAASFGTALLFISFKENKAKFFIYLGIALTGFISLIIIPNIPALITLFIGYVIAFLYRFCYQNKNFRKIIFYIFIGLISLAVIFFIIVIINASNATGLSELIRSNNLLNRIFNNNRYLTYVNEIIRQSLFAENLFGFQYTYSNIDALRTSSKIFAIDLIKDGGLLFAFILVAYIVLVSFVMMKYLRVNKDENHIKIIILTLLTTFFIHISLNYDSYPLVHPDTKEIIYNYLPLFRTSYILPILFILGFIYEPILLKDDVLYGQEIISKNEAKTYDYVDEDYVFDEDKSHEK